MANAVVLFSGPGGTSLGIHQTGRFDSVIGIENDPDSVATYVAAGMKAIQTDVRGISPQDVAQAYVDGPLPLLQGSPPCQGLSMAGSGTGRQDIEALLNSLEIVRLDPTQVEFECDRLTQVCADERSPLTFEVMRWIATLSPERIMLEQVPAALPIWTKIAGVLRSWGYSAWAGFVHAEQFGVPQTRKRAVLLARKIELGVVRPPLATHSMFHSRSPERLDAGVLPWISMAEALGWGMEDLVGFPRKADTRGPSITIDGKEYRARDLRPAALPSFVVTEKARSWTHFGDVKSGRGSVRSVDEPAPTVTTRFGNGNWRFVNREALVEQVEPRVNNQSGTEFDLTWPADRPSPVIAGRGLVTMPGANANRFNGATKSRNDGIRVQPFEAGVLQSFPPDYPWQGSQTSQFKQIGNAVPPLLQQMLTEHLYN